MILRYMTSLCVCGREMKIFLLGGSGGERRGKMLVPSRAARGGGGSPGLTAQEPSTTWLIVYGGGALVPPALHWLRFLKGLFCDFLTHFHPLSHAVRSCPKAEILPRSFFPSPPDTLLPLQAYTCVFLHQVPNVSNLPQVVSWLFPTSAWRGQIPICSLFCSA